MVTPHQGKPITGPSAHTLVSRVPRQQLLASQVICWWEGNVPGLLNVSVCTWCPEIPLRHIPGRSVPRTTRTSHTPSTGQRAKSEGLYSHHDVPHSSTHAKKAVLCGPFQLSAGKTKTSQPVDDRERSALTGCRNARCRARRAPTASALHALGCRPSDQDRQTHKGNGLPNERAHGVSEL